MKAHTEDIIPPRITPWNPRNLPRRFPSHGIVAHTGQKISTGNLVWFDAVKQQGVIELTPELPAVQVEYSLYKQNTHVGRNIATFRRFFVQAHALRLPCQTRREYLLTKVVPTQHLESGLWKSSYYSPRFHFNLEPFDQSSPPLYDANRFQVGRQCWFLVAKGDRSLRRAMAGMGEITSSGYPEVRCFCTEHEVWPMVRTEATQQEESELQDNPSVREASLGLPLLQPCDDGMATEFLRHPA